ncbi:hypothetical protein GCM10008955_26970 [Deinococcus malanensis]|uniref:DinB-like domain-containing protein n=1 Tax=Deinococcus malanensis TaxID=1706855 RepID=A0ABQ2F1T1_9DEIO|nr:DinB family protein [Deinococcus malanensis]GGK31723.1 hypothetical protein GCM10008955_26970 [Deinococcus malanensis]
MPELAEVVTGHLPFLQALTEQQAARKPAPGVWCAKEILGHLIDSGVNNHARFVQARAQSGLDLPGYDQNAWVVAGAYSERSWADVLGLWAGYQQHLAHVIASLPAGSLDHTLSVGGGAPVTLHFLTQDYVAHQLHHLSQIPERAGL